MTTDGHLDLHQRILASDPLAPSQLFSLLAPLVLATIRKKVRALSDRDDLETAVADAFLSYFRSPEQYDGSKSALLTYLINKARYNALEALRQHGRRIGHLKNFELAVRNQGSDDDIIGPQRAVLDNIELRQLLEMHGDDLVTDESDLEVLLLIAAGEKNETAYADALGLTGDYRHEVRRKRDLIRKRLERLRVKLTPSNSE
jgi:DNA-directed RNA polymerase specialized sigma24 family protein